jgi:hypothetical protein
MAKEGVIGLRMINKGVSLKSPKHCFLSTYLLTEKIKNNSLFKHYIDTLPKDYNNFPIFFTDEEILYLEGSPFISKIIIK